MKSYNGYSPEQRYKALAWAKAERAAGRRQAPTVCQACGQTRGQIMPHSEDYSEPFGPHIGAYAFCYLCHMLLHCRHRAPEAWDRYRQAIREGAVMRPFWRSDWEAVKAILAGGPLPILRHIDPRGRTALDEITDHPHRAAPQAPQAAE